MSAERVNRGHVSMADLHNPLFIHLADQANISIVPFKLTGPDNYRQWSRAMDKAFSAKYKLGLLKGALQRSDENGEQWDRCNDLCCTWILGAVSLYDSIFEMNTALEIWTDLVDCFSHYTGTQDSLSSRLSLDRTGQYYTSMNSWF